MHIMHINICESDYISISHMKDQLLLFRSLYLEFKI